MHTAQSNMCSAIVSVSTLYSDNMHTEADNMHTAQSQMCSVIYNMCSAIVTVCTLYPDNMHTEADNMHTLCVKLSLWGGLSRCFTVGYPWEGSQVTITPALQ
jgi:hypothetical protein